MMTSTETLPSPLPPMEPSEAAGCLVVKMQSCSKKNCRCIKFGLLHGPYAWLVRYLPKDTQKEGKKSSSYKWTYLGKISLKLKDKEKVLTKLQAYTNAQTFQTLAPRMTGFMARFETDKAFREAVCKTAKTKLDQVMA